MQTIRHYFTPELHVGEFVRTLSQKPELYELKVNGETKRYRPDLLVEIPNEKLHVIKPRKHGN